MDENNKRSNVQPAPHRGVDKTSHRREEEYATEIIPDTHENNSKAEANSTYGWIGIVLSFLSFLVWPLLFSAAGIILGFMSRSKGADTLGNIAIGIGAVSLIIRLFI